MAKKTEIEKIPKSDTSVVQKWTLEDRTEHFKKLDKAVNAYKKSFLDIALNLYWFDETGSCNDKIITFGTKSIYIKNIAEFAFNKYGISKATTYQYIAIVKKFGKINPDTGFIDKLDDKYKDYSVTALMVMSGMDDFQLFQCKPDMKIKELKALRDGNTNAIEDKSEGSTENNTNNSNSNNDTIPPEPKQKPWENHNSQKLFEIKDTEDFEKRSSGIMDAIKKTLSQNNGKQYHVEINMVWD